MCAQKDDNNLLHPIGYFSRELSRTGAVYLIFELEALETVASLENLMSLTKHSKVHLFTDDMACKTVLVATKQPMMRTKRAASFG